VTEQRHRVRRQVLEIFAPDESSARRLQPQLSRIQRQRIESVIEELCSELSSSDRIHRIDSLEVDLGALDFDSLEIELPRKLKPAMRKALSREIERQDSEARRNDDDPAVPSRLELISHFASNGSLPWWADSTNPLLVSETIDALIEQAPDRLGSLLRQMVQHRDQLLRMVLHGNDRTMLGLQAILASASPAFARVLQLQTEAILGSWSYGPGANIPHVRNLFWLVQLRQVALGSVVADSDSHWRQVIAQVATQSSEAFAPLITGMLRAARTSRDKNSGVLRALIRGVFYDAQTRASLELTPTLQRELLDFLDEPKGKRRDGWPVDGASVVSPAGDDHVPTAPAGRPSEAVNKTKRTLNRPERLDLDFGDADTVYIENSGLVILWPFLPRFLERMELVEGDKFKDDSAQHRAAGLLQHLATEDPSPPEYQTTLNKVLCGFDPAAVLEFGPPATATESEECANLLSSVIAQAPILREMSIDAFRGSFLLRKGLLTARDGIWLLRVERETYDVVLDRFPWSVSWVKFPWMEVPLGVEW
jgi:Contractile injection system tape measure protein